MTRLLLVSFLLLYLAVCPEAREIPGPDQLGPRRGHTLKLGSREKFTFSFEGQVPYNPVEQPPKSRKFDFVVSVTGGKDGARLVLENRTKVSIPTRGFVHNDSPHFENRRTIVPAGQTITVPLEGLQKYFTFFFDLHDESAYVR